MKPLKVPAWFGDVLPEELEQIRQDAEKIAQRAADFQRRPRYTEENKDYTSQEG